MTTQDEALLAWKRVFQEVQPKIRQKRGQIGDGAGNVEVSGRPGWVWIRYQDEQSKLSTVRCYIGYLAEDTPVIIGKRHPEDDFEQVLDLDWGTYSFNLTDYLLALLKVPPHGESHHGTYGSDPAWIDYSNFVFGRVAITDPASMIVNVEPFIYGYSQQVLIFEGYALDLSGDVPASGHLYVLVYFDPDTTSVGYEIGDSVALAASPLVPALEDPNAIPLGVVRLYAAQTEITIDDTWQRKIMLNPIGSDPLTPLQMAVVYEGEVVTHNGEITWST